jgi:prepilin-type N-terminal cleavage/methylation domain-containing protein
MKARQEGFTIAEVIVTMTLLGIILTALGGLTYTTARQAVLNTDTQTLEAASLETVNRFAALPWANLASSAGCDTTGTMNNRYSRCVTVTTAGNQAQVEVITVALSRHRVPPATVRFNRVGPVSSNPLCVGC